MLLINKPPGPTSHDIVDKVRRITGERRVGHTGTLDPFAEGLLIILVGREETKKQSEYLKLDKEYVATIHLGEERDTGDLTGEVISLPTAKAGPTATAGQAGPAFAVSVSDVEKAVKKFTGEQMQMPPEYSAIKIKGKKAYELARKGEAVPLKPRRVTVYSMEIEDYVWPLLTIRVSVSSGTYIRALARDIGRELGTGAYLEKLVRTKIGSYALDDAQKLS